MGQQRVQLGMHVVATALSADDESSAPPEDVVLYFGIIDILQVSSVLQHVPCYTCPFCRIWHMLLHHTRMLLGRDPE